ncbi:GntP family permease [Halopenitus persicus]|uniref:Gluconate:H+ symporter, GntP family n=1 Tax=Halopenitus persicus TaxID=1048396 RepID=A0A1H3FIA2_9EURY|nr:gluconate transporter [Halopenitus persicus]SDX89864.1 gluconate:H+ symporter, GntP family [Halopenitus persicus]
MLPIDSLTGSAPLVVDTILNPIVVLAIGIGLVVLFMMRLNLPAFLALILATFGVGLISPSVALADIPSSAANTFGSILGAVGIPILMAALIGKCLIESGAADRIVRGFHSTIGEGREDVTLLGSSFVLSIPVFFDTVFYLLAPIARAMRARTGEKMGLYTTAIIGGAFAAHALVPPTPGPIAVAGEFGIDLGTVIIAGLLIGFPTSVIGGLVYGRWIDARMDVPLREALGTTVEDLNETMERSNAELPSFLEAFAPIGLAVILVATSTIASNVLPEGSPVIPVTTFFGDANIALTVAALASIWTFYRFQEGDLEAFHDELVTALKDGGNIIAITAAGGAFGAMLGSAGVGDFLVSVMQNLGVGPLVTAWLIAAVLIVSTGSLTVAMITGATIMSSFVDQLAVHPVYLLLTIGTGAMFFAWHNSSPFWIINEIGGLEQDETLRTFSFVGLVMSVTGLIITLIVATVFPMA